MYTFNLFSRYICCLYMNKSQYTLCDFASNGVFLQSSIAFVTSSQDEKKHWQEFPCTHATNTFYAQMVSTQPH